MVQLVSSPPRAGPSRSAYFDSADSATAGDYAVDSDCDDYSSTGYGADALDFMDDSRPALMSTSSSSGGGGVATGRVMQQSRVMRQVLTEQMISSNMVAEPAGRFDAPGADGDAPQQQQQQRPPPMIPDGFDYVISPDRAEVIAALGEPSGADKCYGCKYIREDEQVSPVNRVGIAAINTLMSRYGSHNHIVISKEISDIHRRLLMPHDPSGQEWRAIDVYEHYFTKNHLLNPHQSVTQSIRTLQRWQQDIQDNGIYYNRPAADGGAPQRTMDPKRAALWMAMDKHVMMLLKTDPSKMPLSASCTASAATSRSETFAGRPTVGSLPSRWAGGGGD
jgi:hypothetical protein